MGHLWLSLAVDIILGVAGPIENEVFKTMKDQKGLNFEHNYGHGKAHLCDNLRRLMLVALADQLSYLTCVLFRRMQGLSTT